MNYTTNTKTIKTAHYSFSLMIKNNYSRDIYYSQYLEVGNPKVPCLSLTINTPESTQLFGKDIPLTAKLSNIEALYDCVLEEDVEDLFAKHSFGKELLHWVIQYIRTEFPHVRFLQLDDESYIPCDKGLRVKLDLLSYSITMYCKTWYEMHFNASIENSVLKDRYKKDIAKYGSSEFKKGMSWDVFLLNYVTNEEVKGIIMASEDVFRDMYESSDTFPVFFRKLSVYVGREEKCRFFKSWLSQFINTFVSVERRWVIPLDSSGGSTRKTRRRKVREN